LSDALGRWPWFDEASHPRDHSQPFHANCTRYKLVFVTLVEGMLVEVTELPSDFRIELLRAGVTSPPALPIAGTSTIVERPSSPSLLARRSCTNGGAGDGRRADGFRNGETEATLAASWGASSLRRLRARPLNWLEAAHAAPPRGPPRPLMPAATGARPSSSGTSSFTAGNPARSSHGEGSCLIRQTARRCQRLHELADRARPRFEQAAAPPTAGTHGGKRRSSAVGLRRGTNLARGFQPAPAAVSERT